MHELTIDQICEELEELKDNLKFKAEIIGASFNFKNKIIYDKQKIKNKIKLNKNLENSFKEIEKKEVNLMLNFASINDISKMEGDFLIANGYDDAIIGYTDDGLVVYDSNACVELLCDQSGLSYEDSLDFLEFNTFGAYCGEKTPIFCHRVEEG